MQREQQGQQVTAPNFQLGRARARTLFSSPALRLFAGTSLVVITDHAPFSFNR